MYTPFLQCWKISLRFLHLPLKVDILLAYSLSFLRAKRYFCELISVSKELFLLPYLSFLVLLSFVLVIYNMEFMNLGK